MGNHDYFGGDPEELRKNLASIGIRTLRNDSTVIRHGAGSFVLGGIDDRIMGRPDWNRLLAKHGPPDLLMAHNPDQFYEAEKLAIPLTLSGHTHGGQIRFRNGPAIIRQSRYCLDEGLYCVRQISTRRIARLGQCVPADPLGRRRRGGHDRDPPAEAMIVI